MDRRGTSAKPRGGVMRKIPLEASVSRLQRALERIALLVASYEAGQLEAERVAYEAGLIAVGELSRRR